MEGSAEHRSKPVPASLLCPDRLRAVGVRRSGYDRARRRHGPAELGELCVDDLHRLHRGTRQHARRICRGAGLHLVDPPLNYPCVRVGQRGSAPVGPGLSLHNGLLQVVGTSPEETANPSEGWINSVGRSLCRFGLSSWRHPRDLPRTPDRRLASRYPNAARRRRPSVPQNAYDAARGCARLRDHRVAALRSVSSRRRRG
jgi:hypothetical protein